MHLIASIDGGNLISLIVTIVVAALIFWVINWFLGYISLGEPATKIIKVLVGLVLLVWILNLLMGLTGHSFIS